MRAIMCVIAGERPLRPTQANGCVVEPTDVIWDMVTLCWHPERASRPTMVDICQLLSASHPSGYTTYETGQQVLQWR
jgi:hypothetical protein